MNIIVYPNAKVNIGLRVLRRRPDGFHDIETLFWPISVTDILELTESDSLVMRRYGLPYPWDEDDLCLRAWRILKEDFDIPPVIIDLYKNIPTGAGLGGGSSDGAHTLKGLNELFGLGLTDIQLAAYAARLGSDCPFFIYDHPMFAEGRGEVLSAFDAPWIPLLDSDDPSYFIKVVTPDVHVSTAEAYRGVRPSEDGSGLRSLLCTAPIESWRRYVVNDFEESVFGIHPELRRMKEELYADGAVYAAMSGSGSALFGIFKRECDR